LSLDATRSPNGGIASQSGQIAIARDAGMSDQGGITHDPDPERCVSAKRKPVFLSTNAERVCAEIMLNKKTRDHDDPMFDRIMIEGEQQ
jgi:hypothetical protein